MRTHLVKTRKQLVILLAENTKKSARSTEMRKQTGKMSKQIAILPAETTEMRTHLARMRRQIAVLLNESVVRDNGF
jgi:hypothetical protein